MDIPRSRLPGSLAVSALTLAELAVGPVAAGTSAERRNRIEHLRQLEFSFESLVFDVECARSYVPIYAAVLAAGRKARGSNAIDLMIAATALAHELPLFTFNANDLRGLDALIEIVDLT